MGIGRNRGSGQAANAIIVSSTFASQLSLSITHNLGTRRFLSYAVQDGTNLEITGLATSWVYTDANTLDVTFAAPVSGQIVIGAFDGELFYGDYSSLLVYTHEHAFNSNHAYNAIETTTYDDLRYAMNKYTFDDAYEDTSDWVVAPDVEFSLIAGMPRRYMQTFNNSSTWVVSHELDTMYTFLSIQGIGGTLGADIYSMANSVERKQNEVEITWAAPQSGRVMVGAI